MKPIFSGTEKNGEKQAEKTTLEKTANPDYRRSSIIDGRALINLIIWVLHRFQHCTGHITTGSWEGRGNQYIQLVKVAD